MPTLEEQQTTIMLAAADKYISRLAASFKQAIEEIQNNLYDPSMVEIALSLNDIEGALLATGINELDDLLYGYGLGAKSFVFASEIYGAFQQGVKSATSLLTDELQKIFSFNALGDRMVQNVQRYSMNTVQNISNVTAQGLRTALVEHVKRYNNPNKAAKDIRQLIGLTDPQMKAVLNFRQQLETRQTLGFLNPNERRLNAVEQAMVSRHMREGNFSQANIDAMVQRYYESLVNKRAKDIARTESQRAVHKGQQEMWFQGLEQGIFDDTDRKFWIVTPDDRLRPTHAAIPIMNPYGVKINQMFVTPWGAVNGPGDVDINLINCRCGVIIAKVGSTYNQKGVMVYA